MGINTTVKLVFEEKVEDRQLIELLEIFRENSGGKLNLNGYNCKGEKRGKIDIVGKSPNGIGEFLRDYPTLYFSSPYDEIVEPNGEKGVYCFEIGRGDYLIGLYRIGKPGAKVMQEISKEICRRMNPILYFVTFFGDSYDAEFEYRSDPYGYCSIESFWGSEHGGRIEKRHLDKYNEYLGTIKKAFGEKELRGIIEDIDTSGGIVDMLKINNSYAFERWTTSDPAYPRHFVYKELIKRGIKVDSKEPLEWKPRI